MKELLQEKKIDVNSVDQMGRTPLNRAAINGHLDDAKDLIEAGADVNQADNHGMTPLHWAADAGHRGIAERLIGAGASVNQADKNGHTPLLFAFKCDCLDVAKLLIDSGADDNQADKNTYRSSSSFWGKEKLAPKPQNPRFFRKTGFFQDKLKEFKEKIGHDDNDNIIMEAITSREL